MLGFTALLFTLFSSVAHAGDANNFRAAHPRLLQPGDYHVTAFSGLAGPSTAGQSLAGILVTAGGKNVTLSGYCFGFACEPSSLWETPQQVSYLPNLEGGWLHTPIGLFFEDMFQLRQLNSRFIAVYHYRTSCYPQFPLCQTIGEPTTPLELIAIVERVS